jgi:hypothetical protein
MVDEWNIYMKHVLNDTDKRRKEALWQIPALVPLYPAQCYMHWHPSEESLW